ncbi:MAG: YARHG domain-containing protein [Oscillospiraceae bacterium]|nr:YARHG domain-containing protein [Oscillospiraceae bacterium]
MFADSSGRALSRSEIESKAKNSTYSEDLSLLFMINEIYARHGASFQKEINSSHYGKYEWYRSLEKHPMDSLASALNKTENANIALIVKISEEKGYR